ncbi:MAG: hypothetical protein FJX60_15770 [Alphaproteobacteria bacterium]|nr:hypothetical protein [Alphaproteobacteria bacterium]
MRFLLALSLGAILLAAPAHAQDKKGPPACAAIDFRPIAQGMSDGEQEAGMYRSRFGRIEMMATVKGGAAQDYQAVVNGKPLKTLQTLPQAAIDCAATKKIPATVRSTTPCGDATKLRLVITQHGADKVLATYGLKGKSWNFCKAGTAV